MNPPTAFSAPGLDQFPEEAKLIGRILAGYGELEYALATVLEAVLDDTDVAVKVMFRVRGEEQRIVIVDALMRHQFEKTTLTHIYKETISDMQHCRKIRNQFAHCLFEGFSHKGLLSFVDLEETAKAPAETRIEAVPLTLPLLKEQEAYFGYVQWRLFYLSKEYQRLVGRIPSHDETLSATVARPPRHSADW